MGNVYLCWDRKLRREIAVKVIKPEHGDKPVYRERFQREIEAAIALEGCDVVRIYDHGECPVLGVLYYVMEYLRGRDLREELLAVGRLEVARALELLIDVCAVIATAHEHNIVHRDLKPSNLFLCASPNSKWSVKVLDFGVARLIESTRDGELTQLGGQPGTPNYMSPEQHVNDSQVGAPADLWALGAILYEAVVGEKAWPGDALEASRRIIAEPARFAKERRPEVPAALDQIIQKCLQKRASDRYASVQELSHALRGLLSSLHQPRTSSTQPRLAKPAFVRRWHRSRVLVSMSGAVMLLALGGAVVRPRHEVTRAVPMSTLASNGALHLRSAPGLLTLSDSRLIYLNAAARIPSGTTRKQLARTTVSQRTPAATFGNTLPAPGGSRVAPTLPRDLTQIKRSPVVANQ